MGWGDRITYVCVDCYAEKEYIPWRAKKLKLLNGEYRCSVCSRAHNNKNRTTQQRSECMVAAHKKSPSSWAHWSGAQMRAMQSTSGSDRRKAQLITIKNTPGKYEEYCAKRSKIAMDFHASMSCEARQLHYSKIFARNGMQSAAELQFFDDLSGVGIQLTQRECVSGFFPDGVDYSRRVIVEFYGDTYHCNPTKYKDPTQYCSWIGRTVGEQWDRDRKRLAVFYKQGFEVVIIWQSEWLLNKQNCIDRIINALYKDRKN